MTRLRTMGILIKRNNFTSLSLVIIQVELKFSKVFFFGTVCDYFSYEVFTVIVDHAVWNISQLVISSRWRMIIFKGLKTVIN